MPTITKRQTSPAQAAAARTNGAKSSGPTSPEGQLTARSNRITHGFRSTTMALVNENPDGYAEHLDAYLARYSPIDKLELDLVGLLATNMWQVMRINSIEVALFDLEINNNEDHINRHYENVDEYGRIALAFKNSAGNNALEVLRRYKSTAERAYHRALQTIEKLHRNRPQNNPTDQPEPPPETGNTEHKPALFLLPVTKNIPETPSPDTNSVLTPSKPPSTGIS